MKSLTETIHNNLNEGRDYIVWFPANFDLKTIEKDLKELGVNVKIDDNDVDDPEGNPAIRARVNTTPKKIEKFADERNIMWAPLVESTNESYSSKNPLHDELYKAIKPIFNRFDIAEKYWVDNLERFVADLKNNLR